MHAAVSYRDANAVRRAGYAILPGEGFSYLLHLRPREWPIMAAHTSLGYVLARGLELPLGAASDRTFAITLFVWVVLLNGGTLALNSAYDADEGDIGYLDMPPPPPRFLAPFGFGLMLLGQLISLWIVPHIAAVYLACFVLSIAYSARPLRLKAVAGADWLINLIGFGALTPLAGWLASGTPLSWHGALVLTGFAVLFAGFYPLTQIYQMNEDRARNDRTLALLLGTRRSLELALACTIISFALFIVASWSNTTGRMLMIALPVALLVWLSVLVRWLRGREAMSDVDHKRSMYHALGAWALTDLAAIAAMVG